jgi:hypothetical protein
VLNQGMQPPEFGHRHVDGLAVSGPRPRHRPVAAGR